MGRCMRDLVIGLLWVALGSALGGMARYFVSGFVGRRFGETFPWGTMTVNVTGAIAIGVVAATADQHPLPLLPNIWQLGVVGFIGSYTTVSSFSLQTLALARDGEWSRASGNVLLSLALCIFTVTAGYGVGSAAVWLGWS